VGETLLDECGFRETSACLTEKKKCLALSPLCGEARVRRSGAVHVSQPAKFLDSEE
jgi:hypothetical protein